MMMSDYPHLGERARGWLRFLHRKATTPDDWSSAGKPHIWWDGKSTPPVQSFPRFDLSESSYALPIMADVTPAWREVYVEILDRLIERHTTYWAAIDWLTQIGPDPQRNNYPEEWVKLWIPEGWRGRYDMPGWTANGIHPWGIEPDPIGARGNLFFKGWLNLMLGLYAYLTRDGKWDRPFSVAGYNDTRFDWTHNRISELLYTQWRLAPEGPYCENTKIWPYCLSAAGLGLHLNDTLFGTSTHWVFSQWLQFARANYLAISAKGRLEWMALYYDPLIKHLHRAGPSSGLGLAFYALPQDRAFAELLYHTAVETIGWSDAQRAVRALPDPRFQALGLVLAREFGDDVTDRRMRDFVETSYEPSSFGADGLDFGWHFNFGEPYPRGQLSALQMLADIGQPGGWWRVFNSPNLKKFAEPTVTGVDYPNLGLSQAWNDRTNELLQIRTYVATGSARGRSTSFRIDNLPDAGSCRIRCDGADYPRWRSIAPGVIALETDVNDHEFQVFMPGLAPRRASDVGMGKNRAAVGESRPSAVAIGTKGTMPVIGARTIKSANGTLMSRGFACPCCAI